MHPDPSHPLPHHLATFTITLALAACLAFLIHIPLGLFLVSLALAILLVPYAASLWRTPASALVATACITDAIAAVWLIALLFARTSPVLLPWLSAYGVLLALALLQFTLLPPLRKTGLTRPSAAGLVAVMTLLWLAAPIWLFPHLQSAALLPWMQRLISIHPLFAINSALPTPIWTELPLAYTLSNLNQDVPYTLPASPVPAILFHAILGLLLCLTWIKAPDRTS